MRPGALPGWGPRMFTPCPWGSFGAPRHTTPGHTGRRDFPSRPGLGELHCVVDDLGAWLGLARGNTFALLQTEIPCRWDLGGRREETQ